MSEPAPQSQLSSQEFCKPTVNTIGRWKLDSGNIYTAEIGKCYKSGLCFAENQFISTALNPEYTILPCQAYYEDLWF